MKKHPCDVLHTHTSKAGILARFAAFFTNTKCIVHTPHGHIFWGYFSPLKTRILVAIERFVTRKSDMIITLTQGERKDYLDRHFCTPERIIPIFSGIDLEPYLADTVDKREMRQHLGIPQNAYIAGTVARLVHIKNHDLIVSAAELLGDSISEIKYVFVGDGDLHDHLVNRIEKAGLTDKFIFLGWRNDTAALLKAFDLFVMCSHNEGMGRAFVEAQASGLPVIGSRAGGIPEVLQEGITGYLVPPDDPAVLADSIKKMYNKRNEREAIAKKCREWVNPRFGKEVMVDAIEKIYIMGVNKNL
jgi:glycosyltransferase involved in cell wall biosynthesis